MKINSIFHQDDNRLLLEKSMILKSKENPENFGSLYRIYHESIFRYIYNRIGDLDLANDITSVVFMKALLNIKKYEYRGLPFSSWLFRIAKSELNQSFRNNKKTQRTISIDKIQLGQIMEDIVIDETDNNIKQLLKSLSRLNNNQVELIEMRYFEKRSYREIGQILDITENNAKVKTFRALSKLRKHFKQRVINAKKPKGY